MGSGPELEEERNRSGGEENMDIDTECTSSQARLSVTEHSSGNYLVESEDQDNSYLLSCSR